MEKNENSKSVDFISYGRQSISEDDIDAVSQILKSSYLTTGPCAAEFEKALCSLTGARYAIVCSNGTAALHLACMALGVSQGDLGVTSPNTFLASANCFEFCDGRADFVDIDLSSLCISPEKLDDYCKNHAIPKAVVAVDFAGIPSDLPALRELSKKYGFFLIEDAAHSIGSSYFHDNREYQCGSCAHSDMAIFSFHPVKTITCGEGGAVLTNNEELARRVRLLCSHGMVRCQDLVGERDGPWYYEMTDISFNHRITDFQCALGNSQLKRLGQFKKRRKEIVNYYNNAFSCKKELILPPVPAGSSPCWHLYTLQFAEGKHRRFQVYEELKKEKILCQIHYIPVYWQPYYKKRYGYQQGKCPNAELYYSRCLSLPLYPALEDRQIELIVRKVLQSFVN